MVATIGSEPSTKYFRRSRFIEGKFQLSSRFGQRTAAEAIQW